MRKKSAYLIGIKGVAMTALAVYLKEAGYLVTGYDVADIFPTDKVLAEKKIPIKLGFHQANIDKNYDLVAVTGAHGGMTNKEAKRAKALNLATFTHGEILGNLMNKKEGIAISGSHGKTTTSSLAAFLLTRAGLDPSYALGVAQISGLPSSGHCGKGKYFVVEADEYMTCPQTDRTPRFFWLRPKIAAVTNIDFDHPDAFNNLSEIKDVFLKFLEKVDSGGFIVVCIDDPVIREMGRQIRNCGASVVTYGFSPQADYQIKQASFGKNLSFMRLSHQEIDLGEYAIHLSGRHNLLNSLCASIVANISGISWLKISDYLKDFGGTKRRFEKIAKVGNVLLFDDYAHHPAEIEATIKATKKWYPERRIIVIFQPHTFSRTKALLHRFAKSFSQADLAIITKIYPSAREKEDQSISAKLLVHQASLVKNNVFYKEDKQEVVDFLGNVVKENDLIVTMGAGDIFLWLNDIVKILKEKL